MNLESHFACGWLLGNLTPGLRRSHRLLLAISALAPDVDGLSYLAGPDAYVRWHHTLGHNVFFPVPFLITAALIAPPGRRILLTAITLAAFATHLVGDYFLSGWEIPLLWPFPGPSLIFLPKMGLDHPLNIVLSYLSIALCAGSLWIWNRSPLELAWPSRDALLARLAHRSGRYCDRCHRRPGPRNLLITRQNTILCRECHATPPATPARTETP